MSYSLEPHYRRYVEGQGFMSMSFARNIGNIYGKSIINSKNAKKIFDVSKSMKNKYGKKY